ncbi:MAG: hypothetical protein VXZ53_16760, partial [Planctomycetota bacterium]|nr:hypothetical protein [Planctomycetota bacterium]
MSRQPAIHFLKSRVRIIGENNFRAWEFRSQISQVLGGMVAWTDFLPCGLRMWPNMLGSRIRACYRMDSGSSQDASRSRNYFRFLHEPSTGVFSLMSMASMVENSFDGQAKRRSQQHVAFQAAFNQAEIFAGYLGRRCGSFAYRDSGIGQ